MGTSPVSTSHEFSLVSEIKDGTLILTCRGKLTEEVAKDFKAKVKEVIPTAKRIILDMGGVTHVDSSGLGAVVSVYASARTSGCQFQICSLTGSVQRMFGVTKVLGAFESCGSYLTKLP